MPLLRLITSVRRNHGKMPYRVGWNHLRRPGVSCQSGPSNLPWTQFQSNQNKHLKQISVANSADLSANGRFSDPWSRWRFSQNRLPIFGPKIDTFCRFFGPKNGQFWPIFVLKSIFFGRFRTLATKNFLQSSTDFDAEIWPKLFDRNWISWISQPFKSTKIVQFLKCVWEFWTSKKNCHLKMQ